MREAVTPLLPGLRKDRNLIFIARAPIVDASYADICSAMTQLIEKAGLNT